MTKFANLCLIAGISLSLAACAGSSVVAPPSTADSTIPPGEGALTVATWNVEHLAAPMSAGCRPRTDREIEDLREYAEQLDADIVALQEVASIEALALIFSEDDWRLFISERPDSESYECRESGAPSTQQKTAYAVRRNVEVLGMETLPEFGLDEDGLRYGLELSVDTPIGALTLLNVHMKSGCFVDDYARADTEDCQIFARQTPILDGWVEEHERLGQPFVVLGDFNHRLSAPYNALTRLLAQNSDGSPSGLKNETAHLIGCHPWYPAPIDHIFAGNLTSSAITTSARVHAFDDMDPERMLSDHCAVSLHIEVARLPLSNSVTWQTTSQEYRFLTTATYRNAADRLAGANLPDAPWVVVMDVDETVLDNGAYQVNLDRTGTSFSPSTWADWVASEEATLVPGVDAFIASVLDLGGRLAFVTNRDRSQDGHTWRNMRALGLPITPQNTCLMGWSPQDSAEVDGRTIINDKDLRRLQLESGTGSCHNPQGERHTDFPPSMIVMQVGDNIEDFARTTQEDADIEALLASQDPFYILLPNAMYGSW